MNEVTTGICKFWSDLFNLIIKPDTYTHSREDSLVISGLPSLLGLVVMIYIVGEKNKQHTQ
jgi:hypothetical protein